ncbi:hypothetical protein FRX31_028715 [Thalictrum thalictroides]|uniref:Uncharacterized protein n=1 Tax=Thalictrum thalictroides TaxID=46969 RepID=A0A7J6V9H9_THATH|nr:hypothetical protein FRX31_028715 [Thalictrum thalictroides]
MSDVFGSGTAKYCHFKGESFHSEKTLDECAVIEHSIVYYVELAESVFGEHSVKKKQLLVKKQEPDRDEKTLSMRVHKSHKSICLGAAQGPSEPNVSDELTVEPSLWEQLIVKKQETNHAEKAISKILSK